MKILALILILGLGTPAAAGYPEAVAASGLDGKSSVELDSLLAQPGAALAKSARVAELLKANAPALELFRQAARESSDGYLLMARPEQPAASSPMPNFGPQLGLYRLLLISAKVNYARERAGEAEKDLLAAAGFLSQLSAQKAGAMMSALVQALCLQKAFPLLSDSLRGDGAAPAYLAELAARLDAAAASQDFMRGAMLEEAEIRKATFKAALNPEKMALEIEKLPFLKRRAMKRLQGGDFYELVHRRVAAAEDERAQAFVAAFNANDAAVASTRVEQQKQRHLADVAAHANSGPLASLKDWVFAGPEAKERMVFAVFAKFEEVETPSYGKVVPRYHVAYNALHVLRAALGVKRYQRATRRLPESLAALVPAYLAEVPTDTFNNWTPLSYAKAGRRFAVYSIGPDGKDDGGAVPLDQAAYGENPASDAGDIAFAGY
ncbi:MAG TPA: hypothetical protein DEQ38_06100 [Elusimicrobia bacterium]|nr:MAG: hypothetical protein A2089_08805 [Elusimicrobia bacterium GWD2_63_28]HCC47674.1 hypothetical protein [Elusimicrobiota bacterium]